MTKVENECVGCPAETGCLGDICPNRNVVRFYCDKCHDCCDELYHFDGQELCVDCIVQSLEKVEVTI